MLEPQVINGNPYYIMSMSGLAAFKRCRKSFDLGYVRGYQPREVGTPVEDGRAFHEHMAALATGEYDVLGKVAEGDEMAAVAWRYNTSHPVPTGDSVLAVEAPVYIKLLAPFGGFPGVILRCTFDIAFRAGRWVVLRDYKTFDRAPTLHVDLDFQGRIYTAVGMRYYETADVFFEYAYVRRTMPGVPKDKAGKMWTEDDCYQTVQLNISVAEGDTLWRETQWVAQDMVKCIMEPRFYRQDLKVGPHSCSSCFYRHGCSAEIANGTLTPETADFWYTVREPITIPLGTHIALLAT